MSAYERKSSRRYRFGQVLRGLKFMLVLSWKERYSWGIGKAFLRRAFNGKMVLRAGTDELIS